MRTLQPPGWMKPRGYSNGVVAAGRIVFVGGQVGWNATGEFEDFLTGFVAADGQVWGRPVGVAVAPDGALLVTDDGSQSIWRVSYAGK